jgi:hypothetical protein
MDRAGPTWNERRRGVSETRLKCNQLVLQFSEFLLHAFTQVPYHDLYCDYVLSWQYGDSSTRLDYSALKSSQYMWPWVYMSSEGTQCLHVTCRPLRKKKLTILSCRWLLDAIRSRDVFGSESVLLSNFEPSTTTSIDWYCDIPSERTAVRMAMDKGRASLSVK